MKKVAIISLFLLLGGFISTSFAVEVTLYGPEKFIKSGHRPTVRTETFTISGLSGSGQLIITNHGNKWWQRIRFAKIWLNGEKIFGPHDFKGFPKSLLKDVNLQETNEVKVKLWGFRGKRLSLKVMKDVEVEAAAVIGSGGGVVEVTDPGSPLNGVVISVPSGALSETKIISVEENSMAAPLEKDIYKAGVTLRLEPDGTIFSKPVKITVPYDDNDHDGILDGSNIPEEKIVVMLFSNEIGRWLFKPILDQDYINNTVSIETTHFTDSTPGGIIRPLPGAEKHIIYNVEGLKFYKLLLCLINTEPREGEEAYLSFALKNKLNLDADAFEIKSYPGPDESSIDNVKRWVSAMAALSSPEIFGFFASDELSNSFLYENQNNEAWHGNPHFTKDILDDLIFQVSREYDYAKRGLDGLGTNPKQFIIIGHSWGTVLTELALMFAKDSYENPIKPDLVVTLSAPRGSKYSNTPDSGSFRDGFAEIPDVAEKALLMEPFINFLAGYSISTINDKLSNLTIDQVENIVSWYSASWIEVCKNSMLNPPDGSTGTSPNNLTFEKWRNYWTNADIISGPLDIVNTDIENIEFTKTVNVKRNAKNTIQYHKVTGINWTDESEYYDLAAHTWSDFIRVKVKVDILLSVYGTEVDKDGDNVLDDGDFSGIVGDNLCTGGAKLNCDDNCLFVFNPNQADFDGDRIGDACEDEEQPQVISTDPYKGEAGVSKDLEWITIIFDKEMADSHSVNSNNAAWSLSQSTPTFWSDDRTFKVSRDNTGEMPPNQEITITLNPGGGGFRDLNGNELEEYVFSFTTENDSNEITIPTRTISVDGNPNDWSGIDPIITDAEGDSICELGTDIKQLYLAQDEYYLYWRVDTSSGNFAFGERILVLLFYETGTPQQGPYPNGITVNVNDFNDAFVSARYTNNEWTGLYGGSEYGSVNNVAEGKILLYNFRPFNIEFISAYYWRGNDADPQCDEAPRGGKLILNEGEIPPCSVNLNSSLVNVNKYCSDNVLRAEWELEIRNNSDCGLTLKSLDFDISSSSDRSSTSSFDDSWSGDIPVGAGESVTINKLFSVEVNDYLTDEDIDLNLDYVEYELPISGTGRIDDLADFDLDVNDSEVDNCVDTGPSQSARIYSFGLSKSVLNDPCDPTEMRVRVENTGNSYTLFRVQASEGEGTNVCSTNPMYVGLDPGQVSGTMRFTITGYGPSSGSRLARVSVVNNNDENDRDNDSASFTLLSAGSPCCP